MSKKIPGLKFSGETTWPEIFQTWKNEEGVMPEWQQVARDKGWDSWEEWRGAGFKKVGATKRRWFVYTIPDPLKTVPLWRIGPYKSWQKHFPEAEQNQHTFADLGEEFSPENNSKIKGLIDNFPAATQFVGFVIDDRTIVIIEGHHRATALAMAAKRRIDIKFQKLPTIALTFLEPGEVKFFYDMLLGRSTKKSPK
ncbi:hypothetical protein ACFL2B_00795 [Patescibacteria group bacterium]